MTEDDEAVDPEILRRFEVWLQKSALHSEVQNAMGRFLSEFGTFEALHMTALLSAVAHDAHLVEHLADLMGLGSKATLLRRLMKERGVAPDVVTEVKALLSEADKLRSRRNSIAHGRAVLMTAALEPGKPGEPVGGVPLPRGRRHPLPEGGFSSQAHVEQFMRQNMFTVPQIDELYERAVRLNARAWAAGAKLRHAMGKGPDPSAAS